MQSLEILARPPKRPLTGASARGGDASGPGGGGYFWCLRDSRVETGGDLCPAQYRLGPYATADEATRALETVEKRNAEWDAEDARWTGEVS